MSAAGSLLTPLAGLLGSELNPTQGVKRKMQIKVTVNKAIRRSFLKSIRGLIRYAHMAYLLLSNKPHFVILEKQKQTLLGAVAAVPATVFLVMSGLTTVLTDIYYSCVNRRNILPINAMASVHKNCQCKKGNCQGILVN
jgi:hypothetical protein